MKIILEIPNYKTRFNEQLTVEVTDLNKARDEFIRIRDKYDMGSSSYEFQETGTVFLDNGEKNYISYNGRIWNKPFWKHNNAQEVFV